VVTQTSICLTCSFSDAFFIHSPACVAYHHARRPTAAQPRLGQPLRARVQFITTGQLSHYETSGALVCAAVVAHCWPTGCSMCDDSWCVVVEGLAPTGLRYGRQRRLGENAMAAEGATSLSGARHEMSTDGVRVMVGSILVCIGLLLLDIRMAYAWKSIDSLTSPSRLHSQQSLPIIPSPRSRRSRLHQPASPFQRHASLVTASIAQTCTLTWTRGPPTATYYRRHGTTTGTCRA
jgi:hypothetical protein